MLHCQNEAGLREQPLRKQSFTLIEMLAVMVVILALAALTVGVAGYVQKKMAIGTAQAQLATIAMALEAYKSDWGFYPATAPARISNSGIKESSNNWYLFNALTPVTPGRKVYLRFLPSIIKTNPTTVLPNIFDPWGTPYNYYCSPATVYGVSNASPAGYTGYYYGGYAVGGQVNGSAYDLWSYGPDKSTYVPGAIPFTWPSNYAWSVGTVAVPWTNKTSALDDITNWRR